MRQKTEGPIILGYMIYLSILGIGFLIHGIVKDVPITFALGAILVWTAFIPSLINFFKGWD